LVEAKTTSTPTKTKKEKQTVAPPSTMYGCVLAHGEIKQGTIYVYDLQESDALAIFTHEVIKIKLIDLTRVYRVLIYNLIDGYEKLAC
jgi:hypothetical protein